MAGQAYTSGGRDRAPFPQPQVCIDRSCVGGYEDLLDLDRDGRLDALLAEPPPVDKPSLRF